MTTMQTEKNYMGTYDGEDYCRPLEDDFKGMEDSCDDSEYPMTYDEQKTEDDEFEDENHVIFSKDGKVLVKAPSTLVSYEMPSSVEFIGEQAFEGCEELKSIKISTNVKVIPHFCFYSCINLETVVMHDSVKAIKHCAFWDCIGLKNIVLSKELRYIGRAAFVGCKNLESIVLPDGLCAIDSFAFGDCESLKTITLPKSIKHIGRGVFYGCSSLKEFIIKSPLYKVVGDALYEVDANTSELKRLISYFGTKSEFTLPDSVINIDDAFRGNKHLKKVRLNSNISIIKSQAFEGCSNLEVIKADGVTSVKKDAFAGCTFLSHIEMPLLQEIAPSSFRRCWSLKHFSSDWFTIDNDGAIYKHGIYKQHPSLVAFISNATAFEVPDGVVSIGEDAFSDAEFLEMVSFPKSLISIGKHAFCHCYWLRKVIFPKRGLRRIEEDAFSLGYNHLSFEVPKSVTFIGSHALPDGDTTIMPSLLNKIETSPEIRIAPF